MFFFWLYISITPMFYNQTTHLVLYIETYMKDVLFLAISSTPTKTNILSTLILPKSIFIIQGCKVMVIIIYICIFIHKINKVSFNIPYGPSDSVSSPISPHSQSIHPTILISHRSHLIFHIIHVPSQ